MQQPATALYLAMLGIMLSPGAAWADSNRIANPTFEGTGGIQFGTTGPVPDQWRAFAVGGGAAETEIAPVQPDELFTGSPSTRAVRLEVTAFGTDQGFDNDNARFTIIPNETYYLEFYVKTANADGSSQLCRAGFPLFNSSGTYLRDPGRQLNILATSMWQRVVCPTFVDPEATSAHVSFRLIDDDGQNAILIAWPRVDDPLERFVPPSPELIAQRPTWVDRQRVIGTTYFYWFRWPNMAFFNDPEQTDDALTDHFVDPASVDMMSKTWHKKEVSDMIEAGIDTLWPVYWAAPGNFDHPRYRLFVDALIPLQEALDELIAEGKSPPRIGMFYDTSSLLNSVRGVLPSGDKADLTTPVGKEIFYHTIRSFWATVEPRHWACVQGRPITLLYTHEFAAAYDQSSVDYVYTRFEDEFAGVRPHIIRERSWSFQTEGQYQWGAALHGPMLHDIAAIGPGYDDSAVPREPHSFRSRGGGDFYRSSWDTVLNAGRDIVHVETWNEMHEATDVCESVEYGRQYIELTRYYADRFKALRITGITPAPNVDCLGPPSSIVLDFNQPVEPDDLISAKIMLVRAGPDGSLDTADDVVVTPASISTSETQVTLDLNGVEMPEEAYRLSVAPDFRGLGDRPLYGSFAGSFPTGEDHVNAAFQAQFIVVHRFARADIDLDDDVDQTDFGLLQRCLAGIGVPQNDPACDRAKLDADFDVDEDDVLMFIRCMSGPGVLPDLTCEAPLD